jgi:hypothetical protein
MDPITITITLPADLASQVLALIADLRKAIPVIQSSVQEAADALKDFKVTGPLGIKGGSQ